jgi:hypothetical protein
MANEESVKQIPCDGCINVECDDCDMWNRYRGGQDRISIDDAIKKYQDDIECHKGCVLVRGHNGEFVPMSQEASAERIEECQQLIAWLTELKFRRKAAKC